MLQNDAFSRWLGIEVLQIGLGYCQLQMQVRSEMLNGFGLAHGGITYSLADTALAIASNSQGRQALSIDTRIQHLEAVSVGNQLIATAQQQHLSHRLGRYRVEVLGANQSLVALFDGIVYRKSTEWLTNNHET